MDDTCERMGQLSPAALRITKKAMGQWDHALAALEEVEQIYTDELMKTDDAVEGIRAFLERRAAKWKGK